MKLAVLGSPIQHSKSPAIHNAAYKHLGLDWHYGRIECGEAEFASQLASFDEDWRGLSLTMPLKEVAFEAAASHDAWAKASGAVNTLLHKDGQWHGFNTDVPGLAMALKDDAVDVTSTVIFGAGATAESAILAAKLLQAKNITVLARRAEAAQTLARRHGVACGELEDSPTATLAGTTAVISTLPGSAGAQAPVAQELFNAHLFDVAYDPWPSPLTQRWQAKGGKTSHGINMLINQALIQMRIFVGQDALKELPNEAELLQTMRKASEV